MPVRVPKRVLSQNCCRPYHLKQVVGIVPDGEPPDPPVESNWCVQWGAITWSPFFPCGIDNEVNGSTDSGAICGGRFVLTDFRFPDHTFYYDVSANVGNTSYVQIIRPSSDPALDDLGTYSYDVFGNPSGPITITPTGQNCVLRTFQAIFEVEDPATEGLSSMVFDDFSYDITVPFYPFDTPNVGDLYLNDNISTSRIGPEGTVDVQINGTEITLTVVSLLGIVSGSYSTDIGSQTPFNFTEI